MGVGEIDLSEIKEIASDPDSNYVYQVDDFDAINSIRGDLVNKVCGEGHKRDKIGKFLRQLFVIYKHIVDLW